MKTIKKLPVTLKNELHKICTDLQQYILASNNSETSKHLAYIAIRRIHSAIDNEFKNANSFLSKVK
jgi:hypothetical protein